MTTANGTYRDCGWGEFYFSITCSGPSCDAFNHFPNLTCTSTGSTFHCDNGVVCNTTPNITSTFSLTQPSMNVSVLQQIVIDNKRFLVTQDLSGRATYSNGTSTSLGHRVRRPKPVTFFTLLICLLFFSTHALAQLSFEQLWGNAQQSLESKLPSDWTSKVMVGLEKAICNKIGDKIIDLTQDVVLPEEKAALIVECLEIASDFEFSTGLGELALATPFSMFVFATANLLGCNAVVNTLLNPGKVALRQELCNLVASALNSQPTATTQIYPITYALSTTTPEPPTTTVFNGVQYISDTYNNTFPLAAVEAFQCTFCDISVLCNAISNQWISGRRLAESLCSNTYKGLEDTSALCDFVCQNQCVYFPTQPVLNVDVDCSLAAAGKCYDYDLTKQYLGQCSGAEVVCTG